MHSSSRFVKFGVFTLLIGLFVIGSLHSTSVDASIAAQATMQASSSASSSMPQSCPTLDTSSMMSATAQSMMAANPAAGTSMAPGYLNLELGAVDNCGVQVLQIFSGSTASGVLQPNDIIVAVDCVALGDLTGGSMATASASGMPNCMNGVANANSAAMMGVAGAMSNPTCMNTGVAGGTLRVTNLFFCILAQYHVGDTVTLTLWRGSQQMNVQVVLEPIPASLMASAAATGAATAGAVAPTTASSGSTAAATSPSLTTPTVVLTATPVGTATSPATP